MFVVLIVGVCRVWSTEAFPLDFSVVYTDYVSIVPVTSVALTQIHKYNISKIYQKYCGQCMVMGDPSQLKPVTLLLRNRSGQL